ncbi:MAG: FAD-binding oxidoreductase [bacterium]|nr:FAD-binding oxidoreductase [bacterium]
MRTKADAVVIGGGIIGVAVAFYLARKKFGQVVLVEKEPFTGAGSTTKAAGGIRAQFSTKTNIEMSMLSEKMFANFKEETGSKLSLTRSATSSSCRMMLMSKPIPSIMNYNVPSASMSSCSSPAR